MKRFPVVILLFNAVITYGMEEVDPVGQFLQKLIQSAKIETKRISVDSKRCQLLEILQESQSRRKLFVRWLDKNTYAYCAYLKHGCYGLFDCTLSLERECNKHRTIELFIESLSDKQVSERYKQYTKEK